jgi:hypothetical protein
MMQQVCRVTVNYDRPIDESIQAGGYRFVGQCIVRANFPSPFTGIVDLEGSLVNFNRRFGITSAEVLKYLDNRGLRPAVLVELLAFGATYQDTRKKQTVVALGSVWKSPKDDDDHVPIIERRHPDTRPALKISPLNNRWSKLQWFLAFGK